MQPAAPQFTVGLSGEPALQPLDQRALDTLFSVAYEELRRLAATVSRSRPNVTLSPTTLVNEAWLKLSANPPSGCGSKLHFKRIAARAMRQVLVEAARRKQAIRHGGECEQVTFEKGLQVAAGSEELLALDEALSELARINPRQATMVEARFFGGLDVAEAAELLGVSEATVLRDWRAAKAWLSLELRAS